MDRWEGTATLEWWADRSTCLARLGVRVTAHALGDGWAGGAVLDPPPSESDRADFELLMTLDPLFTLRLDEGSTILVDVRTTVGEEQLGLTAHGTGTAPAASGCVKR
ncbi:hypothetical protein [Kitasatospora sp. NPDC088346]|uniref:hypothetical protein n=1 Tax=Kitasatospora sp. NPDC088346 TaxID=3364073 RepID=UPI00381F7B94